MTSIASDLTAAAALADWLRTADVDALAIPWLRTAETYLLVGARLTGLCLFLPTLLQGVGWKIRLALAFLLALVVAPLVAAGNPAGPPAWPTAWSMANELLLGGALALAMGITLGGVRLAGELIDQQLGLTLTEGWGLGTGEGAGIAGTLLKALAVLVLLQTGGHLKIVGACAHSFTILPPGVGGLETHLGWLSLAMVQESFVLALRLAGPVWGATALVALVWGMLARWLGPAAGATVGVPVRACLGLLVLAFSLPMVADVVAEAIPDTVNRTLGEGFAGLRLASPPAEPIE